MKLDDRRGQKSVMTFKDLNQGDVFVFAERFWRKDILMRTDGGFVSLGGGTPLDEERLGESTNFGGLPGDSYPVERLSATLVLQDPGIASE